MADSHAILRFVLSANSNHTWEEVVTQGRWLVHARAAGVTRETFRRYDTVRQEVVDGPESIIWGRAEEYFATYGTCPSVAQVQAEVQQAAGTGQLSQQDAQSLMSVLGEVLAMEPRPNSFQWAMDLLSAEAKRQRISQSIFQAVAFLHDDPDRALEVLRSVEPPPLETSIVALSKTGDRLREEYIRAQQGLSPVTRLGITAFDNQEGGLRPGQFLIVGGREGSGKSWLATYAARNVALRGGVAILCSGEMTWLEYAARFVGLELGVDPHRIIAGSLGDVEERFLAFTSAMSQVDGEVVLLNRGRYSVAQIQDTVRLVQEAYGRQVDLLVVDPVYKVVPTVVGPKREENQAQVAVDLKAMAMDLALPIFTTHQLNRNASEYPEAVGEVFKYSDAYSDEADWLWRIEEKNALTWKVMVGKGRAGHSHWQFSLYKDLDQGYIGDEPPGGAPAPPPGTAGPPTAAGWGGST